MILTDFHVHTTFCDGKSEPEEVVRAAVEKGIKTLGFSGHAHMAFDESWCMSPSGTEEYKREIARLKAKYADRIEILCGVEQDIYSDAPTDGYDYVIGSVHYVRVPEKTRPAGDLAEAACGTASAAGSSCAGSASPFKTADGFAYLPIDESGELQRLAAEEYFGGDMAAFAAAYFGEVAKVAELPKCDIIGHFDLITKFSEAADKALRGAEAGACGAASGGRRLLTGLTSEEARDPRYIAAWKDAADRLLRAGIPFEINFGAISRGWRTSPYPAPEIREYIASRGGRFILSSDSHAAETLCLGFEDFMASGGADGIELVERPAGC